VTDYLANLPVDELAKWYRRLADFISQNNQDACAKKQPCVADPLAPDMLIKWLENRSKSTIHRFNAPLHLKSSKEYTNALEYHRDVFLTQKKARIGTKYLSKEVWAGVLPRLKGMRGFKPWSPGSILQMEYESNVQYGRDQTDIIRIQLSGTPAERDLLTSLRGWSLKSKVVVAGSVLPDKKVKIVFASWTCSGEDVYDFSKVKGLTLPNPDYGKTYDNAVRPNDRTIKVYHTNAIRLEKAGLASPYKVILNDWQPADPKIKQPAVVDPSRNL
jgi:hypothetical protein